MVFWLIEVLLFVPDIIIGGYFLFVKNPIKTFSIISFYYFYGIQVFFQT
jgi:hypothetical protein